MEGGFLRKVWGHGDPLRSLTRIKYLSEKSLNLLLQVTKRGDHHG